MNEHKLTGRWGEAQAAAFLRQRGYTLLAAGYTSRFGEIDLIVQNRKFLVFVEVKLRKNDSFAAAREFVDQRKQSHPTQLQPRFDVVEIYAPNGPKTDKPEICHWEDAFQ